MSGFLKKHGWSVAHEFAQDGSARKYYRVEKSGRTAILMVGAEVETPGHKVADFIRIAEWLRSIGLRAPEIYRAENRFVLMEDFGDTSFKKAMAAGRKASDLYGLAKDVLDVIAKTQCPLDLPRYYDSRVHEKRRWIIDYYLPTQRLENGADVLKSYLSAWDEIESSLPPCAQGFLHIDFHVENLMLLPDGQCGILDFQGAMFGPKPYDLANLLEDMRNDVPAEIRQSILSQYDDEFRVWYRVLATQFHCRLMGQIIWWAQDQGKPQYLQYLPRVSGYIRAALADPVLAPLANFFKEIQLDFNDIKDLNTVKSGRV